MVYSGSEWFYPLVKVYIANWKIGLFKREINELSMGHLKNSYVKLPEGNHG